jgi:hypothetical protein
MLMVKEIILIPVFSKSEFNCAEKLTWSWVQTVDVNTSFHCSLLSSYHNNMPR